MTMNETFWSLFTNAAHWEFELFLMVLFDGVIIGALFPFLRKHWKHHTDRDTKDDVTFGQVARKVADMRGWSGLRPKVQDWSLSHPSHYPGPDPFATWPGSPPYADTDSFGFKLHNYNDFDGLTDSIRKGTAVHHWDWSRRDEYKPVEDPMVQSFTAVRRRRKTAKTITKP